MRATFHSAPFHRLSDGFYVAAQITPEDVAEAAALGVRIIVNNRPDGEDAAQPSGAEIEAAARAAGLSYVAIPIDHSGFSHAQLDALAEAQTAPEGGILAYCRSGTRSTHLWALTQARGGSETIETIVESAAAAGYDLNPLRPALETLRADGAERRS